MFWLHGISFKTYYTYPDPFWCLLFCSGPEKLRKSRLKRKLWCKGARPTIQNCNHGSKNIQMEPWLVFCCCVMCFIWGLGVGDRDLKRISRGAYQAYEKKEKKLKWELVRRCALLSKSSNKLTLQQTVSLDLKLGVQQCMILNR